jgi:hypothetical protein
MAATRPQKPSRPACGPGWHGGCKSEYARHIASGRGSGSAAAPALIRALAPDVLQDEEVVHVAAEARPATGARQTGVAEARVR